MRVFDEQEYQFKSVLNIKNKNSDLISILDFCL